MPTKKDGTATSGSGLKSTSGEPANENPSTASTTAAVAERLKGVHPKARTKVRDTAEYVTPSLQEYTVQFVSPRYYEIVQYKGGIRPRELGGLYTSKRDAENALVEFLKSIDKFGKAIWPGK